MSSRQKRLAAVIDTAADLNAQFTELNRLRDQVRKAQLSARKSRPISRRTRERTS